MPEPFPAALSAFFLGTNGAVRARVHRDGTERRREQRGRLGDASRMPAQRLAVDGHVVVICEWLGAAQKSLFLSLA